MKTENAEYVVLVDEQDKELGTMEKMQAHVEGKLHRAVSVFIFNSKHELLLQKRADEKYHSAGLWTNTCCSHPRPDEAPEPAAHRRLKEEMGLTCNLKFAFTFIYKAHLDNNLTEHEFDYVYIGTTDNVPKQNPAEVADYKYISVNELDTDIKQHPAKYTEWFKICHANWHKQLFSKNVHQD
ncbi:MAG TPA: isopentenyl-diphosphate Delta-isomerase [Bacteroidia bacterium]|nr:isopentenyl-diphosphate Delta-isomerase [Bacteroidia bacterium]